MTSIQSVGTPTTPRVAGDRRLRVNNVMDRLNVSDSDVRYLARHGKLRGFKIGKLWFFWASDVEEYQRCHPRRIN